MKDRNRGFIVFGVFDELENGEQIKRNAFRKYESQAVKLAAEWTAQGGKEVVVIRTDQLGYCPKCKKVVQFEVIEEKQDEQIMKRKICPSCKSEILEH